jgi:hypothetical protein
MADLVKDGVLPDMLDGLVRTRSSILNGLADMIDGVTHRAFLVLERLGYSPENPPAGSRVN